MSNIDHSVKAKLNSHLKMRVHYFVFISHSPQRAAETILGWVFPCWRGGRSWALLLERTWLAGQPSDQWWKQPEFLYSLKHCATRRPRPVTSGRPSTHPSLMFPDLNPHTANSKVRKHTGRPHLRGSSWWALSADVVSYTAGFQNSSINGGPGAPISVKSPGDSKMNRAHSSLLCQSCQHFQTLVCDTVQPLDIHEHTTAITQDGKAN